MQQLGGGKVDIAIVQIDRRAMKHAIGLKLCPFIGGEDFIAGGGVDGDNPHSVKVLMAIFYGAAFNF